jgi:aspartyl protease family protein
MSLTEYVWSKSKNEFIEIDMINENSLFAIQPKGIAFNKRNEGWLKNSWKRQGKQNSNFISGEYIDALNQTIIVYPNKKEIWYYWGNDKSLKNYTNLTIYREITKNDQVIEFYKKWSVKGGGVIPVEITQAFDKLDYQSVIRLSKEITNRGELKQSEDALLFFLTALSFYQIGDYSNAINDFNKTIAIWGENNTTGETYLKMGICELQIDNFSSSINLLTKAIEFGNSKAYPLRGIALTKNEDHKNALLDYEIAERLGLMDDFSDYYYYGFSYMELASAQYNKKNNNSVVDYRNAIEQFDKSLKMNPNSWATFKMKGKCYELCGDYSKAIEAYRKSLSIRDHQTDIEDYIKRLENYKTNYVNLKKENGVYKVPVSLNGVVNIEFIFDSGASQVLISPEVAMVLLGSKTIEINDRLEDGYFVIADGSTLRLSRFNIKEVQIGQKKIYNVECAVSKEIGGDMLLGQSVLEKLGKFTFDYEKMKLIFQ